LLVPISAHVALQAVWANQSTARTSNGRPAWVFMAGKATGASELILCDSA